jgi:hypothetical protein
MKRFLILILFGLVLIFLGTYCYAQAPTSLELINNAKQYDGKAVKYQGEVIGDVMARGDHVWLHVNDGIIAIGIWAPKSMVREISFVGDYKNKGDIVEVSGIFHRACLEHGGDLDIHALEIRKVAPGNPLIEPINRKKVYIGGYSFIAILLFYALKKFFQKRHR